MAHQEESQRYRLLAGPCWLALVGFLVFPVLSTPHATASETTSADVLVEWAGGLSDGSSGRTQYRRDVRDRLSFASSGNQAHALGQPGVAVLPAHAPPEAAGWLSVADWHRHTASSGLSLQTLTRDDTLSNFRVGVSESIASFTVFGSFLCKDVIRLYARQGTEFINPAAAATAELDHKRPPGQRSWEIGDAQGTSKEREARGSFTLRGPRPGPPEEEFAVELLVTELVDRGDHREELYERTLQCAGSRPPFLTELTTSPPDIREVDGRLYSLYQPAGPTEHPSPQAHQTPEPPTPLPPETPQAPEAPQTPETPQTPEL